MGRGRGVRATSASSIGITFQYNGARCREKLKLPPTPANKKYAERLKATIEHEIATNTFSYEKHFPNSPRAKTFSRIPGQALTIKQSLFNWLDSKRGEIEPETWEEYEKDIQRHLAPAFGALRMPDLMRGDVKVWAASTGLSSKRLSNILIPLRSLYSDAMDEVPPLIERNPLADFKLKRLRKPKDDKIDPFTQYEVTEIISRGAGIAAMVQFWAWSGLRPGEIVALRWTDIDWLRGVVKIARALREGRIKATKTEAGEREVKLLQPAIEALQQQKAISYLAGKEIFLNPRTNEAWAGDGPFRKTAWGYALQRAGVRYRYPNQLRHTYASWMLSAGENPLWVAKQMGHEDWSQIVKTYGKWIPSVDPLAGSRAVSAIYGTFVARSTENTN
jgi:integrase